MKVVGSHGIYICVCNMFDVFLQNSQGEHVGHVFLVFSIGNPTLWMGREDLALFYISFEN